MKSPWHTDTWKRAAKRETLSSRLRDTIGRFDASASNAARTAPGPALERTTKGGRLREADQIGRFAHGNLLRVQVVERHRAAKLVQHGLEGRTLSLQSAEQHRTAEPHF